MKLQNSSEMPISENETTRCRTRMKKVAAPLPPPRKSSLSSNGKSSNETPMTTTPGEDCAIDELLEGRMDLDVVLPDCSRIRMTVDRRMAMMDLLVHVATANKISAGNHIINVGSKDETSVHYTPNTPVGSLDTNTVYIIPKPVTDIPVRKMPKLANQPFEQTFRLQVNLPSNQRMVLRVSPHRTLAELKQQICAEKELNHSSHHLVHPSHPDTLLDLNSTLEMYGYAEISLMSNSSLRESIRSTSTNFIAYQRPEDEKRKKGILGLFSRKKKGISLDASSNGVNSRGVSPARSEISVRSNYQPKQSTKRKPAPAPPPVPTGPSPSPPLVIQCSKVSDSQAESEVSVKTDEIGSTVSHSRHSSDSSGYHEPSVFSDCSENKSPDASVVHGSQALTAPESPRSKDHQEGHVQKRKSSTPVKEPTNLNSVASYSSVSVASTLRKRKAPQPPVPPPLPEAPKESPTSETASLVAEVAAIDPSESTEVFQKTPPAENVDSGLQTVCNETVVKHPTEEENDAAVCDATIPASPDPPVSTTTQPCSSSCSEASVIPKDSEDIPTAADKFPRTPSQSSSPLFEPQDASDQNSAGTDAEHSELFSPKEPEYISQENNNYDGEHPVTDNVQEDAVGSEEQVIQCSEKEGLKSLNVTPHSEVEATMAVLDVIIDEQLQNHQQSGDVSSPIKSNLLQSDKKEESPMNNAEETRASASDIHEVPILVSSQILKETDLKCVDENFIDVKDETENAQLTEHVSSSENNLTSQQGHTKLANFTLGCYHTVSKDIYDSDNSGKPVSNIQQVKEYNDLSQNTIKKSDIDIDKTDSTVALENSGKPETLCTQKTVDVKIISLKEHEKEHPDDFITKGQVQEKCAQFVGLGTQSLGGRSASLHNLTPKKKVVREIISSEDDAKSGASGLHRTQSDQNVVQENSEVDEKQAAFLQEQKRLYEEYQKLQSQFISWQKQLMNNQSLLQNEQIMPKIVFPTFDSIENNLYDTHKAGEDQNNKPTSLLSHSETNSKNVVEELKTRSLPRPKPQPFSLKEDSPVQSISATQKSSNTTETSPKSSIPEDPHMAKSEISNEAQRSTLKDGSLYSAEGSLLKSPNGIVLEDEVSQDAIYEEVKSQTLPRPKPKPQATGAFVESRTMTLNRHTRPKSQVVSVTIGSWQQRNAPVTDIDSSSVASVRSKFQSLENIPHGSAKTVVPVPQEPSKVSTSATHEKKSPTSKPTVPDKVADVNFKIFQPVDKEKHSKHAQKPDATKHVPKTDKVSKSEALSQSRYPKPLIRLTSMKDDFHLPSLRTCNKWPFGEKESTGLDPLRDELRTSAKAPSGVVREKIHRAEVDLRHHSKKENKGSSETHSRHKEIDSRRVSSKSEPGWTQKKYKESDLRQSKSETIPSDSKSIENCSKSESLPRSEPGTSQVSNRGATPVRPTKLHITTVSIHNSEDAQGTTPPEVKSPRSPKIAYAALKYEGTESKLRTMAELKTVLAQKTAEKEEADRKMQVEDSKALSMPVNGSVPPPTSAMPVIPPAAPIPVSSQLVMGKQTKSTVKQESTSQPKVQGSNDPREDLMLEIRGFGGRQALRKVPVTQASWHLKVFGPATHSLNSS